VCWLLSCGRAATVTPSLAPGRQPRPSLAYHSALRRCHAAGGWGATGARPPPGGRIRRAVEGAVAGGDSVVVAPPGAAHRQTHRRGGSTCVWLAAVRTHLPALNPGSSAPTGTGARWLVAGWGKKRRWKSRSANCWRMDGCRATAPPSPEDRPRSTSSSGGSSPGNPFQH
jgi:hypothetical protein